MSSPATMNSLPQRVQYAGLRLARRTFMDPPSATLTTRILIGDRAFILATAEGFTAAAGNDTKNAGWSSSPAPAGASQAVSPAILRCLSSAQLGGKGDHEIGNFFCRASNFPAAAPESIDFSASCTPSRKSSASPAARQSSRRVHQRRYLASPPLRPLESPG